MKESTKQVYMKMAEVMAQRCNAEYIKVGCVLVIDKVVFPGFNEMPVSFGTSCEKKTYVGGAGGWLDPEQIDIQWPYKDEKGIQFNVVLVDEVIPAEMSAISKVVQTSLSTEGGVLFSTHSPSLNCAKLLYSCGISEVYYREESKKTDGIKFLKTVGIQITQLK